MVVWADELPPSASVEGVVGRPQEHNLSCESRSATDVAAFWGVAFAEDVFFRRLPKSDNPHRGFLGDVDLPPGSMPPTGYGVYVEPVAATLRSFGLDAQARREWDLDSLKAELAAGRPVIVWATYDMQLPGVETWVSADGVTSVVVKWQHTFIAVGYDEADVDLASADVDLASDGLQLVDAYDGERKSFSYETFVPAWDQLGRMAVTVRGPLVKPGGRIWMPVRPQVLDAASTEAEGEADADADADRGRSGGRSGRRSEADVRFRFVVDGRWNVGPE